MFDRSVDYPTAVASYDDEGAEAAIEWCLSHLQDGDTLTIWTRQQSQLGSYPRLAEMVHGYSNVEHVVGRGSGGYLKTQGPVLMASPDVEDVSKLLKFGTKWVRALCIIEWDWNAERMLPWARAVDAEVLSPGQGWDDQDPALDPLVVEAMKGLTRAINHNNVISGTGYEKDQVVSALLALKDARIPMDGEAMAGWALAHGWVGKNPQLLARYVADINAGKRPRTKRQHSADYIDRLRASAAAEAESEG